MKFDRLSQVIEVSPYEIVTIRLIPENKEEQKSLINFDERIQTYLTVSLEVLEIIENSNPIFTVKMVKKNLGL